MRESSYYLELGHWFMSLYNDDGQAQTVEMTATVSHDLTSSCPRGCSGNGECVLGYCHCNTGFDGPDCSQSKSFLSSTTYLDNTLTFVSPLQVLAPCCAVTMVSTRTGGVVVIPVGKEQNVQFITTNVKFLTVTTRGTVSVESASVPQDIQGSSVRKVMNNKSSPIYCLNFCPEWQFSSNGADCY